MSTRETYTHGYHESVLRSHRWRTAENSAAYLLGELRSGLELLDVGCGPGTITADLAKLVAPGRVVGLDSAAALVAEARAAFGEGDANLSFVEGDVYDLAYPDDSFDVVHAHQVLQHLGEPVAALVEMRRVCRPDGVVAVRDSDYAAMTFYPELPLLYRWLEIYRAVARHNRAEPDAGRRLLSWAQAAGFAEIRPSASVWCFANEADRAWWGGTWSNRIVASNVADTALEAGLASRAELEAIAAAWLEWSSASDGWFAVLHGEIRCRP